MPDYGKKDSSEKKDKKLGRMEQRMQLRKFAHKNNMRERQKFLKAMFGASKDIKAENYNVRNIHFHM